MRSRGTATAFVRCLLALLCSAWLATAVWAQGADNLLDPAKAFSPAVAMADAHTLDVHYAIAPGYYMYQERFEVRIADAAGRPLLYRPSALTPPEDRPVGAAWAGPVQFPHGTVKYDPTFEKNMEVYHGGVTLRVPLEPGAAAPLQVSVTGQGCADQGVCYPPMTQKLTLVAAAGGYAARGPQVRRHVPPPVDEAQATTQGAASATPDTPRRAGTLDLLASAAGPAQAQAQARARVQTPVAQSLLDLGDTGMAAWLHQAPLWQILGLSLLLGVLLSFTPCVLPMIPILLAIIGGRQSAAGGRLRGLGLAAAYVLGMSVVYTALGVVAGLAGAGLAAWLQAPWVIGSFAVLLALFALAMLGVYTLQAPVRLQSGLQARLQRLPGGHAGGVFLIGMVSALIVGPCVAAPLAGVLLFISQTGDVLVGAGALFAMAWGEGLILLAVGAGAARLLPRAGPWTEVLKSVFGLLLLATAWWMARPLLADAFYVAGWVVLALWAAMLFWSAAGTPGGRGTGAGELAIPASSLATEPMRLLLRALALLVALWGLAQGAGLLAGGRDMLRPLAPFAAAPAPVVVGALAAGPGQPLTASAASPADIRARFARVVSLDDLQARVAAAGRPVMLDFYADWCVSCLEMEKFTFSAPGVAARMGQMLLLQADVTRMTADDRALLKQFDLFGPPGILFFDAHGRLVPNARVVGFLKADAFARIQDRVLGWAVRS